MLNVYMTPGNSSSRKVLKWLRHYHIPFALRDLSNSPLSYQDILKILQRTICGSESLVSHRSHVYRTLTRKHHLDLESLSLSQLIKLLLKYPSMVRRPILFNKRQMEIGYNQDLIRQFLPKSYKDAELKHLEHII